ncbi:MAG: molybdopterin oxidoreductase family protein [Rhodospirillaceae bacterium]|nr:molybdopterin oxidoreductase family protein [Rhodospirillaceae bacterium]
MLPEIHHSACPHDCPSTCALEVEKLDDFTIGRIRGARDNSYTDGTICAKVARYAERLHHPGRLTEPLQRSGAKGDGEFRPISWQAALDEVGEAFLKAEQRHGAEAIWPYYFAGTMGLLMRDGINRLRHAKGYSQFHTTICVNMAWLGFEAGAGKLQGVDPREMAKSDLVIIWGTNAAATQINVMRHAIQARKTRGAKIIVIDPYLNATARQADMHLCLRPGTDGALACAVMHVLFRDGKADWDYMNRYADAPRELEAHLKCRSPEWAAAITGLSVDEIEAFAKLIGETDRTYFRLGFGFTRSRNGPVNMHAALSIATVRGSWQYEGGGAFKNNEGIYPWDKTLIEGLDVKDTGVRMLDQSRIGAILSGDRQDLGDGPPVTALLIQNTNPMMVAPDLNKVHAGFARDDLFTCVHEQLLTDTAKMADIVLPATAFLEHSDLYQGGGHPHIQLGAKIVEPPGEARDNHFVICEIAKRVGAEHPGFDMTGEEILAETLSASGLPDPDSLRAMRWLDYRPKYEDAHYANGFAHKDGKFHFRPNWPAFAPTAWTTAGCAHGQADASGMPEFPDHWAVTEEATAAHPFRLITAPARNYLNSSFTETPTSREREVRPSVLVHPKDAARLGIEDGARVRLANGRGEIVLHAEIFAGLQPGVLVVESIWPNDAFEGGIGINALTGADPVKPIGGAAFHDNAVSLAAI